MLDVVGCPVQRTTAAGFQPFSTAEIREAKQSEPSRGGLKDIQRLRAMGGACMTCKYVQCSNSEGAERLLCSLVGLCSTRTTSLPVRRPMPPNHGGNGCMSFSFLETRSYSLCRRTGRLQMDRCPCFRHIRLLISALISIYP